jgi:hypothetical protein
MDSEDIHGNNCLLLLKSIPCNTDENQDLGPGCSLDHGLILFCQLYIFLSKPENRENGLWKSIKESLISRSGWLDKFLLRFPFIFSIRGYDKETIRMCCSGIEYFLNQPDLEDLKKKFEPLFDQVNKILNYLNWKDIGIFLPDQRKKPQDYPTCYFESEEENSVSSPEEESSVSSPEEENSALSPDNYFSSSEVALHT